MRISCRALLAPFALLAGSLWLCARPARAQIAITPTVTSSNGTYTYAYTVANNGPAPLEEFQLFVDGPVSSYASPTGWQLNVTDMITQVWVEWISTGLDIPVFGSLGGFQVVSTNPPDFVSFSAYDTSGNYYSGFTTGPAKPLPAYGDVNADKSVDAKDVALVLQASGGIPAALADFDAADVAPSNTSGGFGDNAITVADAVRVLRRINGLESRWP